MTRKGYERNDHFPGLLAVPVNADEASYKRAG
jgi:hypothetical protein